MSSHDIAQLILQQGQIQADNLNRQAAAQAQAQAQSGQIWGQTVSALGQLAAGLPAQMQQQKLVDLQVQEGQAKLQALKQSQDAQLRANNIIKGLTKNPDGTYPADQVLQQLGASNIPLEQQKETLNFIDGVNKSILAAQESKIGHLADVANLVLSKSPKDAPISNDTLHLTFAALKQAGMVNEQDEQAFTQMMATNPDGRELLTNIRRSSKKYQDLDKSALEQQKLTAETAKVAAEATIQQQVAAGTVGGLTPEQQAVERARQQAIVDKAADNARQQAALDETKRHNHIEEGLAQQRLGADLSTGVAGPGASIPDVAPGQKNDAFLATLAPPVQAQVKALAEGRMAFPTGRVLGNTYWQNMIKAVARYDPTFDAVNYNARAKTRADFTSGKAAQQINAINTVLGHLNDLSDAAEALHNSDYPLYNSVANTLSKAVGSKSVTNFDTVKKAVADEVTRVWRQSGGSEKDIEAAQANLSASNSPEQLRGAIATYGDLLKSKLDSLNDQYRQGMGTDKIDLVTPKAQAALTKIETRAGKAQAVTVQAPNGKTYTFPTQADAEAFKARAGIK